MKSTGETTNTTEKEQKLPVTEKNGTAPEKTEHILNRLIIGAGVCVAVIAVLIGVKLYRQDRQMDITEPFARSMVLASDPLSAEKRFQEKHIGRAIFMNLIRENVIQGVCPKTIYTRHI